MFRFADKKATPRKRSTSRKRSAERPTEGIRGFSCTLFKDYLVFFGGFYAGRAINQAAVYNLKEGRMERCQEPMKNIDCPKFDHAACYSEDKNMVIFFGGEEHPGVSNYGDEHANPALRLIEGQDGLSWGITYGIEGLFMPSPVCTLFERKLYVYQANQQNGNFGELRSYDMNQSRWRELRTGNGNMRLRTPSQKAIWIRNKLYLFAENVDEKPRGVPRGGQFIEDVYVLNLSEDRPEWDRVSSVGQVPGVMTNVSIAEANEVIYVFGLSHEEEEPKSVLWVFDTSMEKWNKIQDIGSLTARPNQRAVIYKRQLLIIDWDYQFVQIQYQNLSDVNYASQGPSGSKDVCKDKPENFIQDAQNLYSGKLFPDVVFEVEGEDIPAHKALLAYRSNYFMKMFTSGMSESHSSKIPIPHMKSHIFKAILQYIYCNEVELDEQLALDLIPTVDEYVMKGLKGLCEKYLCKQLRKENVVDMLIVADRHEIEELKKACFKFILKNLGNIDENEEMIKLSKTLFIELLKFSTPGSQQKSNAKKEKQEEEKSNFDDRYARSSSKATASFGFEYNRPVRKSTSKKRATSKKRIASKSKSGSPARKA